MPRARPNVRALDDDRLAERVGQLAAEPFVVGGRDAQLMIQVHEAGESKLARRVQLVENVRECHRIRSAG